MNHSSIAAAHAPARPLPVGPGWFESSWDLQRGLEVREEGRVDAALRGWIDAFVGASPVAADAMSLELASS